MMPRLSLPAALAVLIAASPARPETLIQRDAFGRRTGTIEVQRDGSAVLRDVQGRRTGTVERRGDTLIQRDAWGRRTGQIERPPGTGR